MQGAAGCLVRLLVRVYDVGGEDRSATVLVADDNDVALRLCRRVLERAGYKVLTASDGLEAVSLALANSPDLAFLDIAMPGIDGLEAMLRIKAQRPRMVIVVWGAHLLPSDRERFLAAGAVEMMIPPFKLTDLLAVAAKFTGRVEDGQRWVPQAIAPMEATVTGALPERTRDLDRLAAYLEAVWNQVESGQLALSEPNEDLYSVFETLIAGLRKSRAGSGSEPLPRMRVLRRAKHRPVIQTFLSPKYEDDEGLAIAAWDGKVRLGCRCGWRDSRIEPASTAPASTGSLADAWREHVMADMAGLENRG